MTEFMENELGLVRRASCHACGAAVGVAHAEGCAVRHCVGCGRHFSQCTGGHEHGRSTWSGFIPGEVEAVGFGWAVRWAAPDETDSFGRWERCAPGEPGWGPDFNRLHSGARWDAADQKWVRQRAVAYARTARGGPAAIEHQFAWLRRWLAEQQIDLVREASDIAAGDHRPSDAQNWTAWQDAVATIAKGEADVIAVTDLARLGRRPEAAIAKVEMVHAAGGDVVVGLGDQGKLSILDVQVLAGMSSQFGGGKQ